MKLTRIKLNNNKVLIKNYENVKKRGQYYTYITGDLLKFIDIKDSIILIDPTDIQIQIAKAKLKNK